LRHKKSPHSNQAREMFRQRNRYKRLYWNVCDKIEDIIFKDVEIAEIRFDDYDESAELIGFPDSYNPTQEQLDAMFAIGFARFWIHFNDGNEMYFAPGIKSGKKKSALRREELR